MNDREQMDDRIRAALGELREVDAMRAPRFDAVLSRHARVTRVTSLRPRWTAWAAAAAAVIGVIGVVATYRATRPRPLELPTEVVALSSWTPATDMLLREARKHVLTHAPRFGASTLDTLRRDFR
ncbi:MAG TPA: hypothetical protein VKH19_04940 [Gemmatimonadaceae bacterium]|nr:hypothetical protein [Gemmatimonadaceae bacterium]